MELLKKFVLSCGLWLVASAPAQAEWRRAESANFIVYSEAGEGRLREQVTLLEDYAALLRLLTGTRSPPSPNKLRVYFVRGPGQLNQVRDVGRNVGGFYVARAEGIGAFVDTSTDDEMLTTNEILFHEYAHHYMLQYHNRAYPPWYVEGFAEYLMTARFRPTTIEFGLPNRGRAWILSNRENWLSMERLLFSLEPPSRSDVGAFYAQAWLLTHYLFNDPARTAALNVYLGAINRGDEPRAAFQASFGITPARMQRDLTAYAFGNSMTYSRLSRASASRPPPMAVTMLPGAGDDLVLVEANLHVGTDRPDALLVRARRAAAGRTDSFAMRVLAHAEATYGDGDAADRLLTALLAGSPNDAELLYLQGMRHLVAGRRDPAARAVRFRQARSWFGRAHRADPNHYQTLYRYAEAHLGEPNFISENNANILLLARRLAPQVAEIRMAAASMLIIRREFEEAAALLRPLAAAAHNETIAAAARALMVKAEARDSAGVEIVFARIPNDDD